MDFFMQLLVGGLSIGFLYGLSAMGFVMIFKSSSVLNFAHGELLAIGAYFFLALATWAKLPIPLAFLMALGGCFVLGLLIERIFLRPLIGEPLIFVIMLTVGLAAMFKGLILLLWGGNLFTYPDFLPKILEIRWGVIRIPPVYGAALIIGTLFLVLFGLFFKFSSQGIYMRSVADNQRAALSLGVNAKVVYALAWAIAFMAAGVGGTLLGNINGLNISVGYLGLLVLPAVVLGGLNSVPGAIVGGLVIGVLQNLADGYISPLTPGGVKDVFPFAIMVIVLLFKPYGLWGWIRIERV